MKLPVSDIRHIAKLGSRLFRQTGDGPLLLVQFITSRCNAHCEHCFDASRQTEENAKKDLSLEELTAIAKKTPSPFFVILTGGEPFLRRDVEEIILAWAHHARPRVIALPTNGSQTQKIERVVRSVLPKLPEGVHLSVNVSIDGVGKLHDDLRGTPGLFAKAVKTIQALKQVEVEHEHFGLGVVSVLSRQNQDQMESIMEYVLDDLQVPIWAPFLVRGSPRDPSSLEIDIARYEAVAKKFEKRITEKSYTGYKGFWAARLNSAKNIARRAVITRTVREGRRVVPCSAGRQSAVIYSDGSVYPCELLDEPMGNLRNFDYDLAKLWQSDSACAVREVVDSEICACTHENTMTTSVAYAWRQWPSILRWTLALARQN
jgi:MoaA/NifB/PqqE/SkfB family radical SAM enzyme